MFICYVHTYNDNIRLCLHTCILYCYVYDMIIINQYLSLCIHTYLMYLSLSQISWKGGHEMSNLHSE